MCLCKCQGITTHLPGGQFGASLKVMCENHLWGSNSSCGKNLTNVGTICFLPFLLFKVVLRSVEVVSTCTNLSCLAYSKIYLLAAEIFHLVHTLDQPEILIVFCFSNMIFHLQMVFQLTLKKKRWFFNCCCSQQAWNKCLLGFLFEHWTL